MIRAGVLATRRFWALIPADKFVDQCLAVSKIDSKERRIDGWIEILASNIQIDLIQPHQLGMHLFEGQARVVHFPRERRTGAANKCDK